MQNRLARALIASLDGSVDRVLERRFWASPSTGGLATVTELRPSQLLSTEHESVGESGETKAE
jgi:hypothetical protein